MRTLLRLASYSILFTMVLGSYGIAGSEEPTPPPGMKVLKLDLPKPVFMDEQHNRAKNLEPFTTKRNPVFVPEEAQNLSLYKPVTSSANSPIIGELAYVTDGNKETTEYSNVELYIGLQWVQVDLGATCNLYAVAIWHYTQKRVYFDVIVQIADDPNFLNMVQTVFNNDHDNSAGFGIGKDKEYLETEEGRIIDLKGAKARYIRLYSKGNSANDANHYTEVEVWGTPGA